MKTFATALIAATLLLPTLAAADTPVHHIRFISDADHGLRQVEIEGRVGFGADETSITSLADDAYVLIITEQARFEARPGADGRPQLSLTIDGEPRSAVEAARWCADVLPIACRETAVAFGARVRSAYQRDGAAGVHHLLDGIRSPYAARLHASAFLAMDGLTDAEIAATLDHVAATVADDQERAGLLYEAVGLYAARPAIRTSFLACLNGMASDVERHRFTRNVFEKDALEAGEVPVLAVDPSGC